MYPCSLIDKILFSYKFFNFCIFSILSSFILFIIVISSLSYCSFNLFISLSLSSNFFFNLFIFCSYVFFVSSKFFFNKFSIRFLDSIFESYIPFNSKYFFSVSLNCSFNEEISEFDIIEVSFKNVSISSLLAIPDLFPCPILFTFSINSLFFSFFSLKLFSKFSLDFCSLDNFWVKVIIWDLNESIDVCKLKFSFFKSSIWFIDVLSSSGSKILVKPIFVLFVVLLILSWLSNEIFNKHDFNSEISVVTFNKFFFIERNSGCKVIFISFLFCKVLIESVKENIKSEILLIFSLNFKTFWFKFIDLFFKLLLVDTFIFVELSFCICNLGCILPFDFLFILSISFLSLSFTCFWIDNFFFKSSFSL